MPQLKVLVTGANGMVGRNLQEHPGTHEWRLLTPGRGELDLTHWASTRAYVQTHVPDVIIHAAGRVGGIQANMAAPVEFLVANLDMGRNIVMAALHARVPRLLNLGSSCMYPRAAPNPLTEDLILQGELEPTNEGYALAKIVTHRLCEYTRKEHPELRYQTLIPCNLYGRHDKFDPRHSHLLPAIIHKIHEAKTQGARTVDIWGDGTARREFMYAGDLADAIVRHVTDPAPPDLMNIGVGQDHSINDYYVVAARVIGWNGHFVHDRSKPVGMKQKLVSVQKQTAWGWKPSTTLEEGIAITYRHYLEKAGS